MPFQKLNAPQYPPRHWALVSYAGDGKSTFATQMRAPLVVIDADQRFAEVARLVNGEVFRAAEIAVENTDPDRIAARLNENMPATRVGTIVIDSLTAIIAPRVTQALIDKDAGRVKNLYAAFRDKALAMRQLQDAVTRWGTDTLWIYHLNDARDAQGNTHTKTTISATELLRLTRTLNMRLQIVRAGERRGIKVEWARRGREGLTLWDDSAKWTGMPEKIEKAVYDGLSETEKEAKEKNAPQVFQSFETAVNWAIERGAFDNLPHARNAYQKLWRDAGAKNMGDISPRWVADVAQRVASAGENGNGAQEKIRECA